jgi:NAD(P)-dependent dehydrogenase (short-subunit alcohol dehydrogenase family)
MKCSCSFNVNIIKQNENISNVSGLLKRSSPSRIVMVASELHRIAKLDLDDLNFMKSYWGDTVYCTSKLANILISNELARKLQGTGILRFLSSKVM